MEGNRWIMFGRGLSASAGYCAAYWLLWQASFDQWFLPAGLRATVFLLAPLRYWPYLLVGDAAALLIIRAPMASDYGATWAYLSPFLLAPWVTSAVLSLRRLLPTLERQVSWLPAAGIALAIWGTLGNVAINAVLSGPSSFDTFDKASNFAVGNYLGILLLALPGYFFTMGKHRKLKGSIFIRDTGIGVLLVVGIYAAISLYDFSMTSRQVLMMLMFLPAAGLTLLHGWRGAAAGVFMVNLAIAQTMTYTGEEATRDLDVFVVQCALTIAAIVLLAIGTKISLLYNRARQLGISEKRALEMTRSSLFIGENNLREQVLFMAQMHVYMHEQRTQLVELYRAQGKFTEAMLLNSATVEHMQSFESRAAAIYPLKIEEVGLYRVIFPDAFTDFWAGDAEVIYSNAVGMPRTLSVDLQLTAYRCICNAFTVLAQSAPKQYVVKLRTWKRRGHRGIVFKVIANYAGSPQITRSGAMAEIDLERRVKAYGGAMARKQLHCVHVMLWEPTTDESAPTADEVLPSER
jgi:glucose-6-phosphate-specific signal transduction histidine kinase